MNFFRVLVIAVGCAWSTTALAQNETGKVSAHHLGGAPEGACDSWVDLNANGRRDGKESSKDYSYVPTRKPDETVVEGGDGLTIEKQYWRRPATEDDILPEGTTVWEEVLITKRDADGKLVEEEYIYPEGASGGYTTRYEYDSAGRMVFYTQDGPGNTTTTTELKYDADGVPVGLVRLSNMGAFQDVGEEWRIISEGGEVVRIVADSIERTACSADFAGVRRLCREQGLGEDDWVESARTRASGIYTYVYRTDGRVRAQRRVSSSEYLGIATSTVYYDYECN